MRKAFGVFLIVCVISFSGVPQAKADFFYSGNGLSELALEFKKSEQGLDFELWKASAFIGYVVAIYDAGAGGIFISADGATQQQIAKVVVKYMDDHPEKLAWGAPKLIFEAYREAFGIPKKK